MENVHTCPVNQQGFQVRNLLNDSGEFQDGGTTPKEAEEGNTTQKKGGDKAAPPTREMERAAPPKGGGRRAAPPSSPRRGAQQHHPKSGKQHYPKQAAFFHSTSLFLSLLTRWRRETTAKEDGTTAPTKAAPLQREIANVKDNDKTKAQRPKQQDT